MAGRNRTSVQVRFQEKYVVNAETGCWDWVACLTESGYGQFGFNGKRRKAHRVSYELHVGPIPEGEGCHKICVCHKCDNPKCVNPAHLFLGTYQDNVNDKIAKGRQLSGELNGSSVLNNKKAVVIKEMLRRHPPKRGKTGGIHTFLARWFGVSVPCIHAVYSGRTWTNL